MGNPTTSAPTPGSPSVPAQVADITVDWLNDVLGGRLEREQLLEQLRPIITATDHHVGDLLEEFC